MKKIVCLLFLVTVILALVACGESASTTPDPTLDTTPADTKVYTDPSSVATEGVLWEEGQMLPWFPEAKSSIKAVLKQYFDNEMLLSVVALQGLVNKTETRLMVLDEHAEEGTTAWSEKMGKSVRMVSSGLAMQTVADFAKEASGVVLYSTAKSEHYRNLALTVAGLKNAIPMTPETHGKFAEAGVELKVVENLVPLGYTTPSEIYTHMYDTYWKDCEKRLLVSQTPTNTYNLHDYSVGVGAATVYLDCMNAGEKAVFEKFLKDMTPGEGVVLGWFTSERSGISTVAANGLCTVPADFFNNASVYSSLSHTIKIDEMPNKPALENKVYVMFVVSDGDNIQYDQHAMRKKWNSGRGGTAINWTISPALCDIAPNMLNYYYSTATKEDCLISGPSGYGYNLFVNTLRENGAPVGDYMSDPEHLAAYVSVSERYFERSGLRVATIWDKATDAQLDYYTKNSPYLWGLTVQDFLNNEKDLTKVVNGKLVQQVLPCYVTSLENAYSTIFSQAMKLSKNKPQFIAVQLSVWAEDFSANGIAAIEKRLQENLPRVEFIRADHFYALYSEANGLDYNLALNEKLTVEADGTAALQKALHDGTRSKLWTASEAGESTLIFSLGGKYDLSRLVLYHAEAAGKDPLLNTRAFTVYGSSDGKTYTVLKEVTDNTEAISKLSLSVDGITHLKLVINDGGDDTIARLADIEIYGSVAK